MCLKKRKFCPKRGEDKKRGLFAIPFENRFTNQLSIIRSFVIHFAKVIRNYPQNDMYLASFISNITFATQYLLIY